MAPTALSGEIRNVDFADALGERYLSYALSTIMSRSLPDVRDGLKPVHRRILHAMQQLRLDPASGYKKCARVVGDVIGKFHPHGELAVYDALVRLAQDFSQRYPLVDGQGNFGNIDGDNAAAMRYTESRLSAVAQAMLDGIDEDAVDFRSTYDGEDSEPIVLPGRVSRTCSPTAPPGSRSAWRPAFRRTMSASCAPALLAFDRPSGLRARRAARPHPGTRFPDRRRLGRAARQHSPRL